MPRKAITGLIPACMPNVFRPPYHCEVHHFAIHGCYPRAVRSKRRVENWGSGGLCRWRHRCDHLVSGPLLFSHHFRQTPSRALGAYRGTAFFIAYSWVQNLPDETAPAVSDGSDRLLVFLARMQALKDDSKM